MHIEAPEQNTMDVQGCTIMTTTAEKIAIMQAHLDGKIIQCRNAIPRNDGADWGSPLLRPSWNWNDYEYRIKPEPPKVSDYINWDHVGPELNYMARDKDGRVWLYSTRPRVGQVDPTAFIAGNSRYIVNVKMFTSYRKGTVSWEDSLVERPK
jgi:hypothetical protein